MQIKSQEVTYRSYVEQIFFEDDTELVVTVGSPAEGGGGIDIKVEWIDGEPDWAVGKPISEILGWLRDDTK